MLNIKRRVCVNGTPAWKSFGWTLNGLCTFALYNPRTGFLSKQLIHTGISTTYVYNALGV
jgi:hypothetical protein